VSSLTTQLIPPEFLVGNVPYNMGEVRHHHILSFLSVPHLFTGTTHRRVQVRRSGSWLSVRVHLPHYLTRLTRTLQGWCSTEKLESQGAMVSVNSQVFASLSPLPPASLDPWILIFFSQDHETALSAVRNLNNVDVGGRPLRIDLADSDPFLEGKTTVRGELIDGGETRAQWRERENSKRDKESDSGKDGTSFLRNLPQGVPVPLGASALDMISQTLATMNPTQLVEVLAQFKVCYRHSC